MSLSICLIARNEAANLPRALKSVQQLSSPVIVVDTGSTDATAKIARDFGAAVYDFPWSDDFSAARNFAIDRAQTDWILWLDADEELLPESAAEIHRWMTTPDAIAIMVLRRDLTSAADPSSGTEMWQLRLFRRRDELRFRGRCHPEFHPGIDQTARALGMRVYSSGIRLRHYGYLAHLRPAKLERAARLLQLELQDRPGQLYYQIELGRTLLLLGNLDGHQAMRQATAQIIAVKNSPTAPVPLAAALLEYLLTTPPDIAGCPLSWKEVEEMASRWFPASAPLLWLRAQWHYNANDFEQAAGLLKRLLDFGQTQTYDKSASFDPRVFGSEAKLNLAACHIRLAELDEATALLETLQTDATLGPQAKQMLATVRELQREFGEE